MYLIKGDNKWYTWDENSSEFVQTPTPKLTSIRLFVKLLSLRY